MVPVLIGIGIAYLLKEAFSNSNSQNNGDEKKKIFVSFAIEDRVYRDYLVGQARNDRSPFNFIDMSVKEPWDEAEWKRKCRSKIKGCDGMIVLLSKNTWHSSGTRWEIKCAKDEGIPIVGMHIKKENQGAIPPELYGKKIITWSWDKIEKSINKF